MASVINAATSPAALIQTSDGTAVLKLQTGDTDVLVLDENQKVGIGTNTPDAKLTISASGANGINLLADPNNTVLSARLFFSNATPGQSVVIVNSTGGLAFNTGGTPNSSSGTERMRITSDGYLRMNSGTGGIQFNGDTTAANALDDYEEGTFSPTIIGSSTAGTVTYGTQHGIYTKIGRQVSIIIYLNWSSGNGTGNLQISNFPFTSKNDSSYPPGATYLSDVAYTSGGTVSLRLDANSTTAAFLQSFHNTSSTSVAYDGTGAAFIQLTYFV